MTVAICSQSSATEPSSTPYRSPLVPRWIAFARNNPVLSCIQVHVAPWNPPEGKAVTPFTVPFAQLAPLELTRPTHDLGTVLTSDQHGYLVFSAEIEAPGIVGFDGNGPESQDFGFVVSAQAKTLGLEAGKMIPYARVIDGLSEASFPRAPRTHQCGLTMFELLADPKNGDPAHRLLVIFRDGKLVAAVQNDDGTH